MSTVRMYGMYEMFAPSVPYCQLCKSKMSDQLLIRVRSRNGMHRVQVPKTGNVGLLKKQIAAEVKVPEDSFTLSKNPDGDGALKSDSQSLTAAGIEHGAMIFLHAIDGATPAPPQSSTSTTTTSAAAAVAAAVPLPPLDAVDVLLSKQTGLVNRKRDPQFCHHNEKAMCEHCMPLEAYDRRVLEERGLKAISFHAHLRKIKSTTAKSKFSFLKRHTFKVKPCQKHPPWPAAICSDCQPKSMTLDRQKYRHVDHVEFQSHTLVDRFLDGWRQNGGLQRYGFMYGTYEAYEYVPLGIKAVVTAIYEPPQQGTGNHVDMLDDAHEQEIQEMAKRLGLQRIGWIFTDLESLHSSPSQVVNSRNEKTYFMRFNECVLAAHFQNLHPNRCDESEDGFFGSKFVTVVVSGDKENNIHPVAYQVSQQAMDMERDEVFEYSSDPKMGKVAISDKSRFLPEFFFNTTNEYGTNVTKRADPYFAVDYLVVSLGCGFPTEENPRFHLDLFPIENRPEGGPSMSTVAEYIEKTQQRSELHTLSNFHFLLYLALSDPYRPLFAQLLPSASTFTPFKLKSPSSSSSSSTNNNSENNNDNDLVILCESVKNKDELLAHTFCRRPLWDQFFAAVLAGQEDSRSSSSRPAGGGGGGGGGARGSSSSSSSSAPAAASGSGGGSGKSTASWACRVCTYINPPGSQKCDMCMSDRP